MPKSYEGHADITGQLHHITEKMEVGRADRQPLPNEKAVAQVSSESMIAQKGPRGQKKWNKQSMDYVARTGLAGGLAGCAVSTLGVAEGIGARKRC